MKSKIKHLLFLAFFTLLFVTSCQDEESDLANPNNEETIAPNSALANLMSNTVANFGAYDNVLDDSDCFSVELPVTVVVAGVTITIESEDEIDDLEDLIDDLDFDDGLPEFLFPITIIFNDYTEVTIESQEQLENFINNCDDDDDNVIECVDFVYPISFSVFDSEFDIIDTVIIESDESLYNFLEDLEDDENATIVSLNFPVSLEFANGEILEVYSNQELADAIASAQDDCDDDDEDCSEEFINQVLVQCPWDIDDENDDFEIYQMIFNEDGSLAITEGETTSAIGGNWNVEQTDNGLILTFSELTAFQDDLGGDWLIVECEDDEIEIIKNGYTIELEKDCEDDDNCSVADINEDLQECFWELAAYSSSPNYIGLDLQFNEDNTFSIWENGSSYNFVSYWSLSLEGEYTYLNLETDFEDLGGEWKVVDCDDDRYEFIKGDQMMVLEQDCTDPSEVFNCFSDFELVECANDAGEAIFNLSEQTVGTVLCEDPFTASFHQSETNAQANVNPIVDTESYGLISGQVYLRIEASNGSFEVFTVYLNAVECNLFECFQSFDAVIEICDENNDEFEVFNLETAFANCTPEADEVTYYINQQDAENGVNAIPNPQEFSNTTNPQVVYVRVEIENQFEVFPIELIASNCNSGSCTEGDVDGILLECTWNITNFNGSNDLIQWNFDFENSNNIVVIYTDTDTIDAIWTTSETANGGVIVEFSNVAGPDIQAITGEWLVVECTAEQLVLHNVNDSNNEIVFDRTCD